MFSCNAELRRKTPELKLIERIYYQMQEAVRTGSCKMGLRPFFRTQASHFFFFVPYFLFCKMRLSTSFFLVVLLDLPVSKNVISTGCLNSLCL